MTKRVQGQNFVFLNLYSDGQISLPADEELYYTRTKTSLIFLPYGQVCGSVDDDLNCFSLKRLQHCFFNLILV